ncbi:hypothetical protein SK128_012809, partial [Halocaridina rubra]
MEETLALMVQMILHLRMGGTGHGGPIVRSLAGTGPNPSTVVTSHSSNLPNKQLKLSCLDEARSVDLANARPVRFHCTSQEAQASTIENKTNAKNEIATKEIGA